MSILAIDQGTTSTRAILFDERHRPVAEARRELTQHYPRSGWVEHDPKEIWQDVKACVEEVLSQSAAPVQAIGITNQRETVVIWDRETGEPIYPAIVWQDRRTAELCQNLRADGAEPIVAGRTGLVLDPYFSATKAAWILDQVAGARERAERGALALGTIDCFVLWHLTAGRVHATDATNASRTALFNIRTLAWDEELCRLFRVPMALLPEVRACNADFGVTAPAVFGQAIPILGIAGDQQAATLGQACFEPGMVKTTFGTGAFALLNTGGEFVPSHNRLLTTLAWVLDGKPTYALEGAVFIAGAVVQWLRDGLGLMAKASDSDALALASDPAQEIILVPAFTGLGAPWWRPEARGALFGLTRATGPAELVRAALESVAFQTADLIEAMHDDWARAGQVAPPAIMRVDGGFAASNFAMQFLADLLGAPVDRPAVLETTALGAAWLAGAKAGIWDDAHAFATKWRAERRFTPTMDKDTRNVRRTRWKRAVEATLAMHPQKGG